MTAQSREETVQDALTRGWRHFEAGRFDLAEDIFNSVLRQLPNHGNALHLLGRIAIERGNRDEGISLMTRAIAAEPNNPAFRHNLGLAYAMADKLQDALNC